MESSFAILRNRKSSTKDFRKAADAVSSALANEVAKHVPKKQIILVPILRAGLALLPAFLEIFPAAAVGFIGLKRNEKTLRPKAYYQNIPKISKSDAVIVLDPMLATGGSAVAGIKTLIKEGASEENIIFVGIISAPEGIANVQKNFPLVRILCAEYDKKLDKRSYIVPGLGDFGDRYFGG
ncbi:MAG: uracil phosphoribosyltransferase [Candidatus Yonathbacteria bacterium]|nr:uracil phosphoribosyltransferase [Candidatus Yonathbacteria bacterium]